MLVLVLDVEPSVIDNNIIKMYIKVFKGIITVVLVIVPVIVVT